ncbi:DUF305 domain-containing protein [Blastococcus sp. BMG 814]|uniref:DUF305 domain-containing protein n=1 Tax=Blastococcus carthaginiensis TaxID=3050034 RepID=A0ABT9I961_9ACTN|nr:DUF305 domain-containing protein [Blastococcus carthaginiensis]MDP5182111.1 DUF305 domain-containing protein [Blastococcus carthaginiensis]
MTRTTARLTGLTAALLTGALVLAGCADDPDAAGHGSMMSGSSSPAGASAEQAQFDDADVAFAREMIPHHRQAIAMAELAEGRATDPRVLDLTARIQAAQDPEIQTLTGWLDQWGADHMDGMGHDGMGHGAGMMSERDMHALMSAGGTEFDRRFLEQMIVHHTGAVQMAETQIADGRDADAIALAEAIRDSQSAEIAEMQQLLANLGS